MTDDERAIREVITTWFAATKVGDLQTVLSVMTDDAIFMVVGGKPFGRDEFASAFERIKNVSIDGRSDIQEIQIFGNLAYLRSKIEMTITPSNGAAAIYRSGYTLTILRKADDGRWRLARDANLMSAG